MARVKVDIEEVEDIVAGVGDPREREGVRATCSRCDHVAESYGTGPKSRVRCLMLLKEECPLGEANYYVDADEDGGRGEPDPVPRPWWEK